MKLAKESKEYRGLKKRFATYVLVEKKCGVWTGPNIWITFILVYKASTISIGAMRKSKWPCKTSRIEMNPFKKDKIKSKTSWRTLCALNVRNSSANEIFLIWKRSKQEVSNSLGYVLLVRTGRKREKSRPHKKRKLKKTYSKITYLDHIWLLNDLLVVRQHHSKSYLESYLTSTESSNSKMKRFSNLKR